MARILSLGDVGIFTKNQEAAREFYTEKAGLKVREAMPEFGYLALGTTEEGPDASIDVWQPTSDWSEDEYEEGLRSIGIVTGLGFLTGDLEKTVQDMASRGVKVEKESKTFARFWDVDGNTLFIQEEREAKGAGPGLTSLGWVTVVTRNEGKAREFFESLGLESAKVPGEEAGEDYTIYRASPEGTAIMPFTPVAEMYDDPSEYESDVGHIGENTSIMFLTDDAYAIQDELISKGIAFRRKAEERPWGGIAMRVYDSDKNQYMIVQMKG